MPQQRTEPAKSDDLHEALSKLIRTDYGEVIWRDRAKLAPIAGAVSPTTGRTYLYEAVAARKLSAAKWLVRLGVRAREPQGGTSPLPCPWQAALAGTDPVPMLRTLLTSEGLTPAELGQCADDLLALQQRSSTRQAITAAYDAYADVCRRIDRDAGPPPAPVPQRIPGAQ